MLRGILAYAVATKTDALVIKVAGNRIHVVQKFILQFHSKNPAELVLLYNCYHCAVEVKTNYLILYACYDHEFLSCVPQL